MLKPDLYSFRLFFSFAIPIDKVLMPMARACVRYAEAAAKTNGLK